MYNVALGGFMDIRLFDEELNTKFKFRVNGILIVDDKLLTLEMNNMWYRCFPGGHVMVGESTEEAIEREFYEETGIRVDEVKLMTILQNFFPGYDANYHELSFYYIVKSNHIPEEKLKDFKLVEHDHDHIMNMDYKWLKIGDLNEIILKPNIIKDILIKRDFEFKHLINREKDGEEL